MFIARRKPYSHSWDFIFVACYMQQPSFSGGQKAGLLGGARSEAVADGNRIFLWTKICTGMRCV